MSVLKIIETVKEIHQEYIVLVKIGEFYHAYAKDSYILSYLFNYKLKKVNNKVSSCGFPNSGFNKVVANLEKNNINYIVLDRRNNYEVDEKNENAKNNYKKFFDKSYNYIRLKDRVDTIYDYMLEQIEQDEFRKILVKVEEVLYEGREI